MFTEVLFESLRFQKLEAGIQNDIVIKLDIQSKLNFHIVMKIWC